MSSANRGSFDEKSQEYLTSPVHREGEDLDRIVEWVSGSNTVVDVGSGPGHVAGAVRRGGADLAVVLDPSPNMVRTALSTFPGLKGVVSTAESTPLRSRYFDAVTCRIAAHHFRDIRAFLSEAHRILKPGGVLALEDNVAPEDPHLDEFLNRVERLRDPSHVRSYTAEEWKNAISGAGFGLERVEFMIRTLDYETWIENQDPPPDVRRMIHDQFLDPPPGAVELFEIETENDSVRSYGSQKLLVKALK